MHNDMGISTYNFVAFDEFHGSGKGFPSKFIHLLNKVDVIYPSVHDILDEIPSDGERSVKQKWGIGMLCFSPSTSIQLYESLSPGSGINSARRRRNLAPDQYVE
jgi:hypothetical protein